jgi:hypothetical protein
VPSGGYLRLPYICPDCKLLLYPIFQEKKEQDEDSLVTLVEEFIELKARLDRELAKKAQGPQKSG